MRKRRFLAAVTAAGLVASLASVLPEASAQTLQVEPPQAQVDEVKEAAKAGPVDVILQTDAPPKDATDLGNGAWLVKDVPHEKVDDLSENAKTIEVDELLSPSDDTPESLAPAASDSVGFLGGNLVTQTGTGTTVALIDTAFNPPGTHPGIASGRWIGEACFTGTTSGPEACPNGTDTQTSGSGASGWGFCIGSTDPATVGECAHGTQTSEVAVSGSANTIGLAPDAKFYGIRAGTWMHTTAACGGGRTSCVRVSTSDLVRALNHIDGQIASLASAGFPLSSVSISLSGGSKQTGYCNGSAGASSVASIKAKGVPVVIAAGNDSYTDGVGFPACYEDAFTVSALAYNSATNIASYSDVGPQTDAYSPGQTVANNNIGETPFAVAGTSIAAPAVAGVFSLLKEYNGSLTWSQVTNLMRYSGANLTDQRVSPGWGANLPNIWQMIQQAGRYSASASTDVVMLDRPVRILDTRNGTGSRLLNTPIGAGSWAIDVSAQLGVPTGQIKDLMVNLTAVTTTSSFTWLNVGPTSTPNWNAFGDLYFSNTSGAKSNMAWAKLDSDGILNVYNAGGSTQVVVDVTGYTRTSADPTTFINPVRVLNPTTIPGGTELAVNVWGVGGVPSNATMAVVQITGIADATLGQWTTVRPAQGNATPGVSTINLAPNEFRNNVAIVEIPQSGTYAGKIGIYNAFGNTQVQMDVIGYSTLASSNSARKIYGSSGRMVDTRPGPAPQGVGFDQYSPGCSIGTTKGVFLNQALLAGSNGSYMGIWNGDTLWNVASTRPYVSSINADNGFIVANLGATASTNQSGGQVSTTHNLYGSSGNFVQDMVACVKA